MTSVPITPIARPPMLETMVHSAPRAALCARDMASHRLYGDRSAQRRDSVGAIAQAGHRYRNRRNRNASQASALRHHGSVRHVVLVVRLAVGDVALELA